MNGDRFPLEIAFGGINIFSPVLQRESMTESLLALGFGTKSLARLALNMVDSLRSGIENTEYWPTLYVIDKKGNCSLRPHRRRELYEIKIRCPTATNKRAKCNTTGKSGFIVTIGYVVS